MVAIYKFAVLATVNGLSLFPSIEHTYNKVIKVFDGLSVPQKPEYDLKQISNQGFPNPDERPVPGDSPIVQCEALETQILTLHSVVLDPNPPERGANLTVLAKGFLAKDVEDGAYVEVDVRYGFIKLIHQTFDLCEEISKVGLECPIAKGEQTILKEVEIPDEVPPGKYIVNAKAYTKDDEFITCLTAEVEFPPY